MPRVTVIAHNERRILLHDGTAVRTIPCDPYHSLKYVQFDGNRIFHAFGGSRLRRIEETYNDGIFNAYRTPEETEGGGRAVEQVVQISDALGLAKAVLSDDADAYDEMFAEWYGRKMQSDIVEYMIVASNADRVAAVQLDGKSCGYGSGDGRDPLAVEADDKEAAYIVDGRFLVDGHGAAFYRNERPRAGCGDEDEDDEDMPPECEAPETADGANGMQFSTDMRDWNYLCLVADEKGRARNGVDDMVDVPGKGTAKMMPVTLVVIAKIAFLLYPSNDKVFLDQLPDDMRARVARMIRDKEAY